MKKGFFITYNLISNNAENDNLYNQQTNQPLKTIKKVREYLEYLEYLKSLCEKYTFDYEIQDIKVFKFEQLTNYER